MNITEQFRRAIAELGIPAPAVIIPDGKLHRFSTNDRPDDDAGWYVFYPDGISAGAFGDWRTDVKSSWCAVGEHTLTAAERSQHRARMEGLQREREEAKRQHQAEAAHRASSIWTAACPVKADHPYLVRKRVMPIGIREDEGRLLIPMSDEAGVLHSLQFISGDGDKQFLSDGRVKGCFHLIGDVQHIVCLAEGYATAASIHEATALPVAAAFFAGNLLPVALAISTKYPQARIIVCGDHDEKGPHDEKGVGEMKAKEAAEAVGGTIVIPEQPGMDWNDVHVQHGIDTVKAAIMVPKAANHNTVDQTVNRDAHGTVSAVVAQLHTPPSLACAADIMARFAEDVKACGVVGEERNAKLIYLSMTSRVLPQPVSLAIKGASSSGKSYTTETTLKFFPKAAYIPMTAMSERALIYMKETFSHRTLVIYEAVALREQREQNDSNLTAYFVRSLLSEGRISYPVTVRDKNEGFVTKTIVKEGPTNMILTTTATELHGENETRLLSLPTNDTAEQTKAVLLRLANGATPAMNMEEWHQLQDWIAGAEHRVVIPYARSLAEHIPPVAVRLRRDFKAILSLVETHAILHQRTRKRDADGRIIASEADYLAVRELVADLIGESVGTTVPATVRDAVKAVQSLDTGDGVRVLAVADQLKLERSVAQRRLKAARERGYLQNQEEKRGRAARYTVGEALPAEVELLPQVIPGAGVQVCTDTEEVYKPHAGQEVIDLDAD